jgi:hypothetical protein
MHSLQPFPGRQSITAQTRNSGKNAFLHSMLKAFDFCTRGIEVPGRAPSGSTKSNTMAIASGWSGSAIACACFPAMAMTGPIAIRG